MDSYAHGKKRKKTSFPPSLSKFLLPILATLSILGGADCAKLGRGEGSQRFANEPSPQTAVIGSTVVLPCRVIDKVGELQWTRDDFGLGNERELFAFKRYKMIGSHEEGDFSLRISPVTLEDDAEFQCQVLGLGDVPGVRSESAKLSVYVPPERPEILQGPVVSATAGQNVELQCISRGGKPAAEIQWLDGTGREFREGITTSSKLLPDKRREDATSLLSLRVERSHHNMVVSCTASNPAVHQPLSTSVRLEVSYTPEITVKTDKKGYREGEKATLTCTATANPPQVTYKWYRAGALIPGNSTVLVVEKISRDTNPDDIVCEVSNSVGTSRQNVELNVHYGPSFITEPQDVYADEGDDVTLKCDVDSNPDATIVWVGQQEQTVVQRGAVINLKANERTVGNYLCIAKVDGFPEVSATYGLFIKGPPRVKAESLQFGHIGDTIVLDCHVTSASSRSVTVTWSKYGRDVNMEPGHFEELEELTAFGLRHSLLIHNAKEEDFGVYNCSVRNQFGVGVVEISLNEKQSSPLLLAGVGLGLLAAVVAAIILFVRRIRRSRDKQKDLKSGSGLPEKTVTLKVNHSLCNDLDLKPDLDNRSGSSLSNVKDPAELESWDKDGSGSNGSNGHAIIGSNGRMAGTLPPIISSPNNAPTPPPYHLSSAYTPSYLYPEGFSKMSLKNGHVISNSGPFYNNYSDRSLPRHHKQGVITSGFSSVGVAPNLSYAAPTFSQTLSTNQYSPHTEYTDMRGDIVNGGPRALEHTYSNDMEPSSFELLSEGGLNAPPVPTPPSSSSIADHLSNSSSPSSTIPRLGIPVVTNQYIVPPRTQLMQGALATHV